MCNYEKYKNTIFSILCLTSLVDIWKDKDESKNLAQTFDEEMIKEEKRREVEDEIRINVDAHMREELDRLKIVRNTMS